MWRGGEDWYYLVLSEESHCSTVSAIHSRSVPLRFSHTAQSEFSSFVFSSYSVRCRFQPVILASIRKESVNNRGCAFHTGIGLQLMPCRTTIHLMAAVAAQGEGLSRRER